MLVVRLLTVAIYKKELLPINSIARSDLLNQVHKNN
nr:MAG TPA: hypothetical protein [Caudoviricetes sp.]DAL75613.1 MAG TPA: hypothetical protein [Caudoviricetes sp.]